MKTSKPGYQYIRLAAGKSCRFNISKNNSGISVPYIRGQQAKLYLDEILTDPSMISTLPINNIAMVKVIKGAGLIGDAVAIYTMKGNMKPKNSTEKKPQRTIQQS
jgi:hypothetical protein